MHDMNINDIMRSYQTTKDYILNCSDEHVNCITNTAVWQKNKKKHKLIDKYFYFLEKFVGKSILNFMNH